MKRTFIVLALVASMALVATSCGTTAPAAAPVADAGDPIGDFIWEVRRDAPENALVGVGVASHTNRALATSTGQARALADLARQLNVMVTNMITDYIAGSEADQSAMLAFQESVTQTLAREQIRGATPGRERMFPGNQLVVTMVLAPNSAANNIQSASASAAALAPHMGAAMWALDRMDNALAQQNMAPPVVRDYD